MSGYRDPRLEAYMFTDIDRSWCLWRPDYAGFDSKSIFEGALTEE